MLEVRRWPVTSQDFPIGKRERMNMAETSWPRTLAEYWDITLDKFFADPDDANLELAALLHRAFFTGALATAMLIRTGATADDLCAEIYAELPDDEP
jgi:hypothetical protein